MAIYRNTSDAVVRVGMQVIAPGSELDLSEVEMALPDTRALVDAGTLTTRAKVADAEAAKAAKDANG